MQTPSNRLWLALYLPQLPLQCAATGLGNGQASVVYETRNGRQNVFRLDSEAVRAGIEPGMPLTAARALCHELIAIESDPERERAALHGLALWALQFTSQVSLEPPYGLILEIGASLGLFKGLDAIRQRIASGLDEMRYEAHTGVAPVAAAAWLLALHRQSQTVTRHGELAGALRPLPLALLPIDAEKTALYRLGLKSIGDCLRLPRDGLGQRLGPELLDTLDRTFGRAADPREFHAVPERFEAQILLPQPVDRVEPLLFVLQRLLRQLGGFLHARDAGTQCLRLGLIVPRQSIEYLQLTLLQPGRDPDHLFKLWQERLERHRLRAPVEGLELRVTRLLPLAPPSSDLLGTPRKATVAFTQTLERLRNRLGDRVIRQPLCTADHRPERCGMQADFPVPTRPFAPDPGIQRPLWLLPQPRPLQQTHDGGPYLQGPLTLLTGPERIESGWWDGGGQRRDYYIARSGRQQRLWIYRDLGKPPQWFLHGFFA